MAGPGTRGAGVRILPWAETEEMRPAAERRIADVYCILMNLMFIVEINFGGERESERDGISCMNR